MRKADCILVLILAAVLFSCGIQQGNKPADKTTNEKDMTANDLSEFGRQYAEAWSSQQPGSVADHFTTDGSLTVNNGTPAVGRDAISKTAESFMTAFPDLLVTMDSMPTTANGTEFHWTLTGTNTGPDGTGNKVQISGVEIWELKNGLIKKSQGSFDEAAYNRQLKKGAGN